MFSISLSSKTPIYEQLVSRIEELVLRGVLEPNNQLASVREFATQLAVNPNTIQKAYTELERRGVINTVSGKGCFITDNVEELKKKKIEFYLEGIKGNAQRIIALGQNPMFIKAYIDTICVSGNQQSDILSENGGLKQ